MEIHAQISVNMPMELMKKGVGWQDRAVYTEAILYCRDKLTDGVIHRNLLGMWMPDLPAQQRAKRLDAMRAIGALVEHPDGWAFPDHVWARWGKMRAEVEAKRREEAERKAGYRARRQAETADVPHMSQRDNDGTDPRGDNVSHACPSTSYPEPETEPYPEPEPTSPSSQVTQPVGDPTDDEGQLVNDLMQHVASARSGARVRNPGAYDEYLRKTTIDILRNERDAIRAFLAERPHLRSAENLSLAAQVYEATRSAS